MSADLRMLDGNRIWRAETDTGTVVQKLYRRRGAWPREDLRAALGWITGRKSSPRAAERRRTERRLLALWRRAGFDVPRDLTERHGGLGGPGVLVFEHVDGPMLRDLLRHKARLPRERRDPLLRRFARDWALRHDVALHLEEPAFVQEHGSIDHTLVAGERLVTIDLEHAHLPGQPIAPLVAKEIVDTLRSLAARTRPEVFVDDVRTIVDAYDDDARLAGVVREYNDNPRLIRRMLWSVDRWLRRRGRRTRKYAALGTLADTLAVRRLRESVHDDLHGGRAARPSGSAPTA